MTAIDKGTVMYEHDKSRKNFCIVYIIFHDLLRHSAVAMPILHSGNGKIGKHKKLRYGHTVVYGVVATVEDMADKCAAVIPVDTRVNFLQGITKQEEICFQCGSGNLWRQISSVLSKTICCQNVYA